MQENELKNKNEGIRINKYLSTAGVCSRREADRMIEAGRIAIDGRTACMGDRLFGNETVTIDQKPISFSNRRVLLLFYKPCGLICSSKRQGNDPTVVEYLNYPERIYPVGRLDKDSEGLLLMTNLGDLADRLMRSVNRHEREYLVDIDRPVTRPFLDKMAAGVEILDTRTRPCTVEKTGRCSFRIILTQGLNRQIRRMCEALGCKVVRLKRIRIENLLAQGLRPGEYREITPEEYTELLARLGMNAPAAIQPETGSECRETVSLPQRHRTGKRELHK